MRRPVSCALAATVNASSGKIPDPKLLPRTTETVVAAEPEEPPSRTYNAATPASVIE